MGEVIATIPDGTPAFTVERLMTPPCGGELNADGRPISPLDCLPAGHALSAVIEVLQESSAW